MSGRAGGGAVALLLVLVALLLADTGDRDSGAEREGGKGGRAGSVASGPGQRAEVLRVVDGDTIAVSVAGSEESVRYIGVDTPETVKPGTPVECYGKASSSFNRELVEGQTVRLVFDRERRDHYGRLLAYVYAGDLFVNAELIRRGYARTLEIEPNTSEAEHLSRLEQRASRAGRGLWSAC